MGTPHIEEYKETAYRFGLTPPGSGEALPSYFTSLTASKSRLKTPGEDSPKRNYRAEFKWAQNALVKGDTNLAHARCVDLINGPNLPPDIKIETIQVMSTMVPLDEACCYLEDAIRIATELTKNEPKEMYWRGLLATTHDLLWMVHKQLGAVKFHCGDTFKDPYVAARVRDIERKEEGHLKKDVGRERECGKTLYKRLKLNQTHGYTTLRENLEPKFSCSPCI